MGPPGPPKRCLLCRHDATPSTTPLKSAATSLCSIFGLPDTHPFKLIYERSQYCAPCLEEIQQADLTLGKLELIKQNLLRFQNRVYSKLGDNYFQIENRENLNLTFEQFEKGGPSLKGRKFSYDEIVKVVYEKLDRDCLKWERFSSEGHHESGGTTTTGLATEKIDGSTQTDGDDLDPRPPPIIIPDINDDSAWGVGGGDLGDDGGHHEDDGPFDGGDGDDNTSFVENSGGNTPMASQAGSPSKRSQLNVPDFRTPGPSISDLLPPEASHLFTKAPLNFDEKINCPVDPDNCKRFFYDQYNLGVHIRSFHEGNPLPHECSVCKRGFIDEGRLKAHYLRIHSNLETFMCDQCGKGFPLPNLLREHVKKRHILAPSIFPCTFCNCPLSTPGDLQEHEDKHRSLSVPFGCVFCTDSFPNSSALRHHFTQSHGDPKFGCHMCGKLLGSEASLKNHLLLHTSTFKCELCEYTGSSKNGLKHHMISHSTEKPHCCEFCGKSFKQARNLTSHKRVHTGEKPYGCGICGMRFREKGYLRRHEESHTEGMNYWCGECGAGFKVKEGLRQHERTHREGYVPRKGSKWRGRTEEEKERRRLRVERQTGRKVKRRELKEEGDGGSEEGSPPPKRRRAAAKKDKVKRSPRGKGRRKRAKKVVKEEESEEDGDFYEEDDEDFGGDGEVEGGQVVMEVGEMESAIASIGGGGGYGGGQQQGTVQTQYIPVTFVGMGGGDGGGVVRTASQLVVRRGQAPPGGGVQQQQQGYTFGGYKL